MLDQSIATLLSTLLGGLLTVLGGFVGSYYIQSTSNKVSKRKEIRNIIESIYKDIQKIERRYQFIDENFRNKDMRKEVHEAMYDVDEILDHVDLLVNLYLTPLSQDYFAYAQRLRESIRKSGTNFDKATEALKEDNNVDLPRIDYFDAQFRLSLRKLLQKEGYSYF